MPGEDKSLMERIEFPTIPREAEIKFSRIEEEFSRARVEQLRKSVIAYEPIYKKRDEIISLPSVQPDFWARVFSSAPAEIDEYILEDDGVILGECLKNLTVERFEVDAEGNGEPRSLRFTFEFDPKENTYFDNAKLVKDFYWRKQVIKTSKGKRRVWEGLVSDPVRINWKSKEQDPTNGLLDAACDLFDAEKKGGDRKSLPEYEALVKKLELIEMEGMKDDEDDDEDAKMPEDDDEDDESPAGVSFFSFFGYRGRAITAEQNKEAIKEDEERWAKISKGEEVPEDDDDEDDDEEDLELLADDLEDAEIFTDGEELAIGLAEDLWVNALKYYAESFQPNFDFEDLDMEQLEAMDEDDDEDEDERPAKKARN
ncbi:hypothetical protein F1880_007055 [Penicillium rolfsii]|nr:hypothetical protein F1880_007055 [Penicillium rolfsii]